MKISAKESIINKCVEDCCCGNRVEAKSCEITKCPLHAISRLYLKVETRENSKPKRVLTEEHKAKLLASRKKN